MTNHTPGPWRAFNGTDVFTDYEGAKDGFQIADCHVHSPITQDYPEMDFGEQKANARLVAAAPELYEVLAALEPHLDAIICYASTMGEHEPNRIAKQARDLIAKNVETIIKTNALMTKVEK